MAAGTAYAKRFAGGFVDGSGGGTPIDSTFLNAEETALLQLIGVAPTVDGQVAQWDFANTRFGPALLLNKNIDPAAAIAKSKLDFTGANGIVNADIAGAAAIAYSKLNLGNSIVTGDIVDGTILNADINAAAAISMSKINGLGLYRKVTSKVVNNSIATVDLLNGEITVGANVLGASGMLRLTAFGDYLQLTGGGTNNVRWQLVFGGTTVFDTGAAGFAWGSSAARQGWKLEALIANTATNAQVVTARLVAQVVTTGGAAGTALTTGEGFAAQPVGGAGQSFLAAEGYSTAAVDTTASKTLVLNVINPVASANVETKLSGALVEIL